MQPRKIPVEITGHIERVIWVNDLDRGTAGFKPISWVNDDYNEADFLPWHGDSEPDDCPF